MELTEAHRRAMRRLAIDRATAEVVAALGAAGITAHLLKGPTLDGLLYDAGEERHYTDVDVLVPPDDELAASALLAGLGFTPRFHRWETDHAWAHHRDDDAVWVDLHRTVSGCRAAPEVVHAALTDGADDRLALAGVDVPVLPAAARVLHAVVHAGRNGPDNPRSMGDLTRAVARADHLWDEVVDRAHRADALAALVAGLRLTADGRALASRLGLDDVVPAAGRGAVPLAGGLERLARAAPGTRWRLARSLLLPSRGQVAVRFPWSRRSPLHLVAAVVVWPVWVVFALVRAARDRVRRRRS